MEKVTANNLCFAHRLLVWIQQYSGAAKKGDRPLCGSGACKYPEPRELHPINHTKISTSPGWGHSACVTGVRDTSNVPLPGNCCICICMHQWVHTDEISWQTINRTKILAWVQNAMRAQCFCYVTGACDTSNVPLLGTCHIWCAYTNSCIQHIQMQYHNKRPCHVWICCFIAHFLVCGHNLLLEKSS